MTPTPLRENNRRKNFSTYEGAQKEFPCRNKDPSSSDPIRCCFRCFVSQKQHFRGDVITQTQKTHKQGANVQDNLLPHSIHQLPPASSATSSIASSSTSKTKRNRRAQIILALKVPCALLATILPFLHPKDQRQQTRSLSLLSRKRHHNLQ